MTGVVWTGLCSARSRSAVEVGGCFCKAGSSSPFAKFMIEYGCNGGWLTGEWSDGRGTGCVCVCCSAVPFRLDQSAIIVCICGVRVSVCV